MLIIQKGMETVRRFQDWAGPAVWVAMLVLAVGLMVKAGGFSFEHGIPMDVLLDKTKDAGVSGQPGSFWALMAVGATWITYFAALYLNFCDFSRYAKNKQAVRTGNLWGLPVNLIAFTLVAGITTIAAFKVYGEVLLHPEQISAKFDSWVLALIAALTFAVATLGINVVANFVSAAFDISNVFPHRISFKRGGYIAAAIALVLYPFAPWEGGAAHFVNAIGATMGPLLGIILVDYYLVAKGNINVPALYDERGEYRYEGGWNVNALIATGIGAVFSTILPTFTNLLPAWWGTYGWFFGVAIGGAVYYVLAMMRPRNDDGRRASLRPRVIRITGSARDLGFDELGQLLERLLPPEVAHLDWNGLRNPLLDDVQLGATRHLAQADGGAHFTGQVRIVEAVRVLDALVRDQFAVLAAEGVRVAGREVRERHLVGAADACVHVVDLAREAIWRKPLRLCVGIEERAVDTLRLGTKYPVETSGACSHDGGSFRFVGRGRSRNAAPIPTTFYYGLDRQERRAANTEPVGMSHLPPRCRSEVS